MAVNYGFFNSLNGDRLYNADDVNTFLEGLISSSGIFANVDNMLQVTPGTGMAVNIGTGKAMINNHWCRINAIESVTLAAAHAVLNRYDAIVLRLDIANRQIITTVIQGTNASSPSKPTIVRNDSYYDLCLAYVYVGKGVTSITAANITDMRLNSSVCGIIAGLVQQLDTSQFFAQMQAWMTGQQAAYESWFATLTQDLQVNTYITSFDKYAKGTSSQISVQNLDMEGYTYEEDDVLLVYINGLAAIPDVDYLIDDRSTPVQVHLNLTGSSSATNEIYIKVLKSKIGDPIPTGQSTTETISSSGNDQEVGTTTTVTEVTE